MNSIVELLNKRMYCDVYNTLEGLNFKYTLESVSSSFNGVGQLELYCYLLYVLSKQRTKDMYILICEYLSFLDVPFHDVYTVIGYHIDIALVLYPNDYDIMDWIISMFHEHPDSPFSKSQLILFAKKVLAIDPNNDCAKHVLFGDN